MGMDGSAVGVENLEEETVPRKTLALRQKKIPAGEEETRLPPSKEESHREEAESARD